MCVRTYYRAEGGAEYEAEIANIGSTFDKARRKGFERFYHKGKMNVGRDGWV